jgi:hypothetical protein
VQIVKPTKQRAAHAIVDATESDDTQWYRGSTRVKQRIPSNKLILAERGFWRGRLAPADDEDVRSQLEEMVRYYRAVEDYANNDLPTYDQLVTVKGNGSSRAGHGSAHPALCIVDQWYIN